MLVQAPDVKVRLGEVLSCSFTAFCFCMDPKLLDALERLNVQLFNQPSLVARMDAQVSYVSFHVSAVTVKIGRRQHRSSRTCKHVHLSKRLIMG